MAGTRRKPGRLGPYVDGYGARLLELGYTPPTVRGVLKQLGQLGRWMTENAIDASGLNVEVVTAFIDSRRAGGHRRVPTVRSFVVLLDYLRNAGVVSADAVRPAEAGAPLDELLAEYRKWMTAARDLSPLTVLRYERVARRFLSLRVGPEDQLGVRDLTGADVAGFLLREFGRLSVGSAKGRVAELRSLLRFLHLQGLTALSLATSVPPVAGWHDAQIPATMSSTDLDLLLASCDRSNTVGARDFAILMLLARLGLRSVEVANLELEDLDWRAGEVVVRGKSLRQDRLPLPIDAGEALVAHLSRRGQERSRRVFLTAKAPRRPIPPAVVGEVVGRACKRAGVPVVGAHRLRHALATEMLRRGASIVDISQVLRHQDLGTTAVYAKVDLGHLREVAQPWPGATR
jgi:site-specific recombinase XerD